MGVVDGEMVGKTVGVRVEGLGVGNGEGLALGNVDGNGVGTFDGHDGHNVGHAVGACVCTRW